MSQNNQSTMSQNNRFRIITEIDTQDYYPKFQFQTKFFEPGSPKGFIVIRNDDENEIEIETKNLFNRINQDKSDFLVAYYDEKNDRFVSVSVHNIFANNNTIVLEFEYPHGVKLNQKMFNDEEECSKIDQEIKYKYKSSIPLDQNERTFQYKEDLFMEMNELLNIIKLSLKCTNSTIRVCYFIHHAFKIKNSEKNPPKIEIDKDSKILMYRYLIIQYLRKDSVEHPWDAKGYYKNDDDIEEEYFTEDTRHRIDSI
jgi:hypothetical protein